MRQVIEKRIGVERFTDKLLQVSKHEGYTKAAKQPQLVYKSSTEVFFDYEFTKLFRKFESEYRLGLMKFFLASKIVYTVSSRQGVHSSYIFVGLLNFPVFWENSYKILYFSSFKR